MSPMSGDGSLRGEGNVANLVRAFAASQPNVPALVDKNTGRVRTFAELAKDLDETAAALRAAGIKPGDRTALFVATGIEFVTLVYAIFQVGGVPVLIDPGMGAANVLNCIREQQPSALVGIAKAHVLRVGASSAFRSVKAKVLVGGSFFPGAQALDKLKKQGVDTSVHAASVGDTAAILYTSGSTGAPKGVVYTHGMLAGQTSCLRDLFGIRAGEIDVACFLPFALFSVAMGMTAVFPDMDFRYPAKADPTKILAALEGATSAFASPALWEPFSRFLDEKDVSLPGLTRVLTAGAPVRPQLHERLLRHLPHGDVHTPYGATEALPVAVMNGRKILDETGALTKQGKGTCVGTLAPGVEVKILAVTDEPIATMKDARELPRGDIGEIVVSGPCVTRAYDTGTSEKGALANKASKIEDGERFWHRMGDVGYLDERGRLWFCGRKNHRVDTPHGMLCSIPVEAVAETMWRERAALVGLGPRGKQHAVVFFEAATHTPRFARDAVLDELRKKPGCAHISDVLLHIGPFPVDRRHNAKIEREQLARLAAERLPHLKDGVTS
jgi:acyl-CoA synthetase (AMP-forming)/AMP-acid ligase II